MLYTENYRGFGNGNKIYLRGRLLSDPILKPVPAKSFLSPFIDNVRRFLSREKKHYPLNLSINGEEHLLATDDEGYFTFESQLSSVPHGSFLESRISGDNLHSSCQKIIISNPSASFGIISDIDDTILHTQVTSFWRMLYYSLFKTPWKREAVEDASNWFNILHDEGRNPIFYLSHSPWNLYQNIIKFLELGKFPEGPVLLRDYGFHILEKPTEYAEHKKIFISKILDFHPGLPFVLIGDAGEKDPQIYFEFLEKSEARIKMIYIRQNTSMPQDLSIYQKHPKFCIIENFKDATQFEKKLKSFS